MYHLRCRRVEVKDRLSPTSECFGMVLQPEMGKRKKNATKAERKGWIRLFAELCFNVCWTWTSVGFLSAFWTYTLHIVLVAAGSVWYCWPLGNSSLVTESRPREYTSSCKPPLWGIPWMGKETCFASVCAEKLHNAKDRQRHEEVLSLRILLSDRHGIKVEASGRLG